MVQGQGDTMMQDGTFIHAVDDHRANMVELQANVVETESSLEHCHPEFIDHCDSLGKKQESQNETTEKTSDRLVHKHNIRKGIPDNCEGVTMNHLDKEETVVRRNCFKETSHDGTISFRADTIRDTDWDVVETVPNQESAIPQLQGGITVRKDAPNEDAD